MTVQKLISLLKKMPPRAKVAWQDHDHSAEEMNASVGCVWEASPELKARGIGVVLRP